MTAQQDARERATRAFVEEQEWSYMAEMPRGIGESFGAGWDAHGHYDEQRIAALVAACNKIDGFVDMTHDEFGDAIGEMREALRALAGSEESGEVTNA